MLMALLVWPQEEEAAMAVAIDASDGSGNS